MDKGYKEAVINSKILANHFQELCEEFRPPYKNSNTLLNFKIVESNNKILKFLTELKRLITEGKCDAETFRNSVTKIKNIHNIHLEILWYLEISQILTFEYFIKFQKNNDNLEVLQHVSHQILDGILKYKTQHFKIQKEMLTDFVKIIFKDFANEKPEGEMYSEILDLIIMSVKEYYEFNDTPDVLAEQNLDLECLLELFKASNLNNVIIKLFCFKILEKLLQGVTQTTRVLLTKQEKMKNKVKDKKFLDFCEKMSEYCTIDDLIKVLKIMLFKKPKDINWDNMLVFITFIGNHFSNGWNSLKIISNEILKESFKNCDGNLLGFCFLISRQSCFEKSNNSFGNYIHWFSSTFSSESKRPINSKQTCTFFFNFLTDLVPYDSPYYLKVHINKTPWVSADCQSVLTDYITLVKTQLSDLNISSELGICENTTGKSAAVFDVENVIKHFEKTNGILNSVFQAHMFFKDYYEKKFLVQLLSKFDGKKSARHKLIMKLHSLGKIPNSMYKSYKSLEKNK